MGDASRRRIVVVRFLLAILLLGVLPASAAAFPARRYSLTEKSQFQSGCFPPCLCPILLTQPVRGHFLLVRSGAQDGGLFDTFAVRAVRWTIADGPAARKVRGRGTYRIGGEFALTQRLELDLSIDGAAPQHFDSGEVSPRALFPEIVAAISRNGMVCFDEVFTIDAVTRERLRTADQSKDGN